MDERASPPPVVDTTMEGIGYGIKATLVLMGVYCVVLLLFVVQSEWRLFPLDSLRDPRALGESIADFYKGAAFFIGIALILGGLPALVIGVVGGALIGWSYRWLPQPLSADGAALYGFGISFLLLGMRLGIGLLFLDGQTPLATLADEFWWIAWYAPNLIAFFGFWWVAVKMNGKR